MVAIRSNEFKTEKDHPVVAVQLFVNKKYDEYDKISELVDEYNHCFTYKDDFHLRFEKKLVIFLGVENKKRNHTRMGGSIPKQDSPIYQRTPETGLEDLKFWVPMGLWQVTSERIHFIHTFIYNYLND